ncbi:MAG: twin-arginine translocase TatA/TatE family subunit [Candidatus Promineofilum sp.]|nr:twin-arginine translocase TatA/TatE family subunit [Promineifilum sp.]MCW5863076.1 twin-arginine translocase TatA/TatE family subunit [Anaerolineae bacterium]
MLPGGWEWIIILVIVLLIFGVGRIARVGGELGKGVSAFRQGLKEGQEEKDAAEKKPEGNGDNPPKS